MAQRAEALFEPAGIARGIAKDAPHDFRVGIGQHALCHFPHLVSDGRCFVKDEHDALADIVQAGKSLGVVLRPCRRIGSPVWSGSALWMVVAVPTKASRPAAMRNHFRISGHVLVRSCGSVLAVTATRASSHVKEPRRNIQATSADLPTPCPDATASRITSSEAQRPCRFPPAPSVATVRGRLDRQARCQLVPKERRTGQSPADHACRQQVPLRTLGVTHAQGRQ